MPHQAKSSWNQSCVHCQPSLLINHYLTQVKLKVIQQCFSVSQLVELNTNFVCCSSYSLTKFNLIKLNQRFKRTIYTSCFFSLFHDKCLLHSAVQFHLGLSQRLASQNSDNFLDCLFSTALQTHALTSVGHLLSIVKLCLTFSGVAYRFQKEMCFQSDY